jgi:lipopolysaccharide transport system ATP-binding protein
MSTVIKVENLSKTYRLGQIGKASLQEEIAATWAKLRGKPDPTLPINQEKNWREGNLIHALQDINFEVKQGEVLGIIGKNGAGKSTLLKILSKVTSPSSGQIKICGRIASLLEVGTGMHPELTGRENIFLNGAILGMHKAEIKSKLDAIIDFAGISDYIDTPIKRYSSGMRVRLGFAVAAFLEPEILIVDEVLAVGDAEFQKKAIGKMQDVSKGEGRTVLFVSHNVVAVKSLCSKTMLLKQGVLTDIGNSDDIINLYLGIANSDTSNKKHLEICFQDLEIFFLGIRKQGASYTSPISNEDALELNIKYELKIDAIYHFTFHLLNEMGDTLFSFSNFRSGVRLIKGKNTLIFDIPGFFFNQGIFILNFLVVKNQTQVVHLEQQIISFQIIPDKVSQGAWLGKEPGFLKPRFECRNLPRTL